MKNISRKFISIISPHNQGKKVYFNLLANIKKKKKTNPYPVLLAAINRLRPGLKLISKIKSGKTIYLPHFLNIQNSYYFAINWLLKGAEERNKISLFSKKLTEEILDALDNSGLAYKSKRDYDTRLKESRALMKLKATKKNDSIDIVGEKKNITSLDSYKAKEFVKTPFKIVHFSKMTGVRPLYNNLKKILLKRKDKKYFVSDKKKNKKKITVKKKKTEIISKRTCQI